MDTTNEGTPETGREQPQTDQQHEEEREISRAPTPTEAPIHDEPASPPAKDVHPSPQQPEEQHEYVRMSTPELPHREEEHPQKDQSSVAPPSSPPVSRSPSPQPHDISTIAELPPTNTHLLPEPHARPQSAASSNRSHPAATRVQTHSRASSHAHRPSSRLSARSRDDRGPMDLEGRQRAKMEEAKEARRKREHEVKKKVWTGMGDKPQGW